MLTKSLQFFFFCLISTTSIADTNNKTFKETVKETLEETVKEQIKTMQDLDTLIKKQNFNDPELENLEKKALKASRVYYKARKSHPKLQAVNKVAVEASNRLIKANLSKDKAKMDAAMSDFIKALKEIELKEKNIPELVKLNAEVKRLNQAVKKKRRELIEKTPEGKKLIDKLKALDAKLNNLFHSSQQ